MRFIGSRYSFQKWQFVLRYILCHKNAHTHTHPPTQIPLTLFTWAENWIEPHPCGISLMRYKLNQHFAYVRSFHALVVLFWLLEELPRQVQAPTLPSDYKFILIIINYMLNLIRNLFHFNGFESAKLDLTLSVIEFSANSPARKYLLEIEGKPRIEWETRDDFSRREISNWQAQCNGGEWIKFTLQNSMHKTGKLIFPLDSLTL